MIISFLRQLFGRTQKIGETSTEQRDLAEIRKANSVGSSGKATAHGTTTHIPADSPYSRDIRILEEKYGELYSGQEINLTLHDALALLPRKRRRADAYQGLRSELRRLYGVSLNIVNKNANENNNENRPF